MATKNLHRLLNLETRGHHWRPGFIPNFTHWFAHPHLSHAQ